MEANINNISYITAHEGYHIVTEFSVLPVETFETEQQAREFIEGYLGESYITETHQKGEMLRNCIEIDMNSGMSLNKVRDVGLLECITGR